MEDFSGVRSGGSSTAPRPNQMSRADSLSSIAQYGRVVPTKEQAQLASAPRKKESMNPFSRLLRALGGK